MMNDEKENLIISPAVYIIKKKQKKTFTLENNFQYLKV